MASEHTEQPGTGEARIDRDRAQNTAVGTSEEPRVLPRSPAAPRLSPALSVTLNAALDRLLEVLGVDGGVVRLLEEETNELVLVAQRGLPSANGPRGSTLQSRGRPNRAGPATGHTDRRGAPLTASDPSPGPPAAGRLRVSHGGPPAATQSARRDSELVHAVRAGL